MRHSLTAITMTKRHAEQSARTPSRYADVRDFTFVALFVSAFMTAGYLALWVPVLSHLRP